MWAGARQPLMLMHTVVFLLLSLLHTPIHAAECRKISEVCTEPNMTKIISGHPVYRECWKYTSQYECVEPDFVDTCSQLLPHGCWQTNSSCDVVAFNGECLRHKQTYRCPNKFSPPLPGTTYVGPVYTITKDTINDGCVAHEANPYCEYESETCIEPGGVRNINGLDVYKDCWKSSRSYTCSSDTMTSDCDQYANNPNCQLIKTQCAMHRDDGTCALYTRDYRCITGYTESKTVVDCGNNMYCLDGISGGCFNASYEHDKDFAHAVTMFEISRQAGTYIDPNTMTVFNGVSGSCSRLFGGLSNCCKNNPKGSGMSNQNIGTSLAYQAVGAMLIEGVEYIGYSTGNLIGSFYTYDHLFMSDAPNWLVNGIESIFGQFGVANTYTFDPSISVFGFTGTFGVVPQTTLGVANIKLGSVPVFGGGNLSFYFNPAMFAMSVAFMVISQLLDCDEQEKVLALRKGAGLCHEVGQWCSKKVLGTCLQRKRGYCCYNSKLARIIQQQAKPRLGLGWGDPRSPNCGGLTPEQLASLDFSTMDFSEFYTDVRSRQIDMGAAATHVSGHAQSILDRMGEKYRSYFDN